jgi:YVTN family beta-propeller protein
MRFAMLLLVCFFLPWASGVSAQTIVATITVGEGPTAVSVDPVSNKVYVANYYGNTLSVIDGATNTVEATVPAGTSPGEIVTNSSLHITYASNETSRPQLTKVNANDEAKQVRISNVGGTAGLAVNPVTGSVYVCQDNNTVVVLDGKTNQVITTLAIPQCAFGMAVNPVTNLVYVATFLSQLAVIDGSTNQVVGQFPLDLSEPDSAAVDSLRNQIAIGDLDMGVVEIIDLTTGDVLQKRQLVNRLGAVAFTPGNVFVMVTDELKRHLFFLRDSDLGTASMLKVGEFPAGIAVNPVTRTAYVTNLNDNTVSVIALP